MFAQKIQSLQQRIIELEQQQQQYVTLDTETNSALALIARLREQAAPLGELETLSQMLLEALQPVSTTSPAPQEPDLETRVQQVVADFRRDTKLCEVLEAPLPTTEELERRFEKVVGEFEDECLLSKAMDLDLPNQEILEQRIQQVVESVPAQFEATLVEEEITIDHLERYLDPQALQEALGGDVDLAVMEIASLLDASLEDDLSERLRFFAEKLPSDLGDRLTAYLPKPIALLWVEMREKVEAEARASIFPEPQIAVGTRVEVKSDGEEGTVSWIGQDNNGEPVASVTVSGATRGGIPVEELEVKSEASPTSEDPEVDELARLCLKQKAWSQMRLFADCNAAVIIRMQELASTKAEKRIINNLPSLILGYIGRANDRSDLQWLPEPVLSEVEALLAQPQVQAIA